MWQSQRTEICAGGGSGWKEVATSPGTHGKSGKHQKEIGDLQ